MALVGRRDRAGAAHPGARECDCLGGRPFCCGGIDGKRGPSTEWTRSTNYQLPITRQNDAACGRRGANNCVSVRADGCSWAGGGEESGRRRRVVHFHISSRAELLYWESSRGGWAIRAAGG